jgi:hypothetical protein
MKKRGFNIKSYFGNTIQLKTYQTEKWIVIAGILTGPTMNMCLLKGLHETKKGKQAMANHLSVKAIAC